jgi:serine/threonine-protein kinase
VHANSAQIAAAENVAMLLAPDPAPAAVPGVPGAADPTQVLRTGAGAYDPNAATSVLPHTSGPAGAADPTTVMPNRGAADPTTVMPQNQCRAVRGQQNQGGGPEQPHPWQNQLRAARDRNEQTQIQPYLDPARTRCAAAPSARSPARSSSHRNPAAEAPAAPAAAPPQRRSTSPATAIRSSNSRSSTPRRAAAAARSAPAAAGAGAASPAQPRQRSANPMKIPGLGCLKGCLFTIVLLFVAGLAGLGTDPASGLDRHGQELLAGDRPRSTR